MNTGIQFLLIACRSGLFLRVRVNKLVRALEDNQLSTFDPSTSSSSSAVLHKPTPSTLQTIAGLSGKETPFDFFENVPGGMRIVDLVSESCGVGVPDSDLE